MSTNNLDNVIPKETPQKGWDSKNIDGDLHVERDLHVGGKLYSKKTILPYKGLFGSFEQLKENYPKPSPGDYADVGYVYPSSRYVCEERSIWKDSGQPGIDPSVVIADYNNPLLISRLGYADGPIKIDDAEYLLSWPNCNIHYGKCETKAVSEGSINIASSLGPEHSIGYIVFDNNSGAFNYYSEDTIPDNRDELLLIAVFKNNASELVFSTSPILDDVEDPITPIEILDKIIGDPSDEANANGSIYARLKAVSSELAKVYNSDLIISLQVGSSVEAALTIDGEVTMPSPGDILKSGSSMSEMIYGLFVLSSRFNTRAVFSYITQGLLTTVTYNTTTSIVTDVSLSDLTNIGTSEDVANEEGSLYARIKACKIVYDGDLLSNVEIGKAIDEALTVNGLGFRIPKAGDLIQSETASGVFVSIEGDTDVLLVFQIINLIYNIRFNTGDYIVQQKDIIDMTDIKKRQEHIEDVVFPLSVQVTGGGLFEKGTTENITVQWTVKKGASEITADSVTINDMSVQGSSKVFNDVSETTKYIVKATKDGKQAEGSTTATFVAPIYLGFAQADTASELGIVSLVKQPLKTSPNGSYSLSNNSSENYLWLCVPDSMNISTVKSGGFDVPMESSQIGSTNVGTYKCYRSSSKINSGVMNIVIS